MTRVSSRILVPNEILAEIFTYATEDLTFRLGPRFTDVTSEFATPDGFPESSLPTFAQVCTQWRVAALACSRLWDTITITWPTDESDGPIPLSYAMEKKKEMCKQWLQRSGARPLSIYFSLENSDNADSLNDVRATKVMFDLISPHLHRLRHFHMICHLPTLAQRFKNIGSSQLPLLESLSLEDSSESGTDSKSWWFQHSFNRCYNLRALVLNYGSLLLEHVEPLFPWSQLTHLDSTLQLSPHRALETIEACPHLERASLFLASEFIGVVRIVRFSLKNLSLSGHTLSVTGFLRPLMLPKIDTLQLNSFDDSIEGDEETVELLSTLATVLSRSKSPLTTLSLISDRRFCRDTQLLDLLVSIPQLHTLALRERDICLVGVGNSTKLVWLSKAVLRKLAAGKILPGLKCLRLECPTGLTGSILLDLVKNRRSQRAKSEEVVRLEYIFAVTNAPLGVAERRALESEGRVIQGKTNCVYTIV